jgi:tripeptide aminopeptidase
MSTLEYSVKDRFIRYVQIDTEADPASTRYPSSAKQLNLAKILKEELNDLGLEAIEMDEWGYVYATIPSNSSNAKTPVICFCSHMDTAPDCSGTNVKPIVHRNYNGADIILPDDPSQVITINQHSYLKEKIGDDIITASGTTLLGADDKAGVAIIMDLAEQLIKNPEIKHGEIRILFTPDEEVGRGVEKLDMKKVNADYGYTLDGGKLGDIEDESFSADGVKITIHGISAHPGYAKNKMVNALKVGAAFIEALPKGEWSPETTEKREGFVHPVSFTGGLEKAEINFIIRDHQTSKLKEYEIKLEQLLKDVLQHFKGAHYEFEVSEQYRNMKEIIEKVPFVTEYAIEAMKNTGITPKPAIIRGGTDGSKLSFMGMPCPNIFTGEMAIHSKHEYVSVQDMQKAVNTLIELVQIWEKHK